MYEQSEWADKVLTEDPLTTEEEQELFRIIQGDRPGKQEAIDKLVVHNLKYAMSRARSFAGGFGDEEDLFQVAVIALITAANKAKPSEELNGLEVPFIGYAGSWIWSYMQRYRAKTLRAVKLPDTVHKDYSRFLKWEEKFFQEHHRMPYFDEVEQAFAGENSKYRGYAMTVFRQNTEYDRKTYYDGHCFGKIDGVNPEEKTLDNSRRDLVQSIFEVYREARKYKVSTSKAIKSPSAYKKNTDRNIEFIVSRFGLDGRAPMTLELLANRYGVSREGARQIEVEFFNTLNSCPGFESLREEAWNNISS